MARNSQPTLKYCTAPWTSIHINQFGFIKTCCAGWPILGNLDQNPSLQSALNMEKLAEIRQSIKQGQLHPDYCRGCINAEKFGPGERNWHNSQNPDFDFESATLDQEIVPTLIDIRWNKTCNLSCNYCDDNSSSKWAAILDKQYNTTIKPYYQDIVEYISKYKTNVRQLALVGGEPLLFRENVDLIQHIHDDTYILVITNATADLDTNKVFAQLVNKPRVSWSLSFDNVGERFEYVRHGATFDNFNSNIQRLASLMKSDKNQHHGGIHAVYNIYNCTRLCELRRYADSVGLQIHWQTLFLPRYLDVSKHSKAVQRLALAEISRYKEEFVMTQNDKDFLLGVENMLSNIITVESDVGIEFMTFTEKLESVYHPDTKGHFEKLWPEIYKVL